MKKLSFLFISLALVTFVSLSSCKTSTEPTTESEDAVVEEVVEETGDVADTLAVDVAAEEVEATAAE